MSNTPLETVPTVRTIGLYSFPKSGNTWLRQILAGAAGQPMALAVPGIHRHHILGEPVSIGEKSFRFYKSHGRQEVTMLQGQQMANDGIIYVMRHPLDVFLSYLNYLSDNVKGAHRYRIPCSSVEDVIARGDLDIFFSVFLAFGTLAPGFEDAGSWFENVAYWTGRAAHDKRVIVIRYEDMHRDLMEALKPVATLLKVDIKYLAPGVEFARERTRLDGRFFWKQKVNNYKDLIPSELISRFDRHHGDLVRHLGYSL